MVWIWGCCGCLVRGWTVMKDPPVEKALRPPPVTVCTWAWYCLGIVAIENVRGRHGVRVWVCVRAKQTLIALPARYTLDCGKHAVIRHKSYLCKMAQAMHVFFVWVKGECKHLHQLVTDMQDRMKQQHACTP